MALLKAVEGDCELWRVNVLSKLEPAFCANLFSFLAVRRVSPSFHLLLMRCWLEVLVMPTDRLAVLSCGGIQSLPAGAFVVNAGLADIEARRLAGNARDMPLEVVAVGRAMPDRLKAVLNRTYEIGELPSRLRM